MLLVTHATENFMYEEFNISSQYPDVAESIQLTEMDKAIIKLLCQSILEPLRKSTGPILILSGKRNMALNRLVGGSNNSDHLWSCAVDIKCKDYPTDKIFKKIYEDNFPYKQLIRYLYQDIIHVSINIPGRDYQHEALVSPSKGIYNYYV